MDDRAEFSAPNERLVIRPEDLRAPSALPGQWWGSTPAPPGPPTGSASAPLPPVSSAPAPVLIGGGSAGLSKLGKNAVTTGLLGGTIGGLLGAVVLQGLYNPEERFATSIDDARFQSGVYVLIVGAVLGFVLLAWDGFTSGVPAKGFRDGLLGAVAGGVSGFVGGYLAQYLYSEILKGVSDYNELKSKAMWARAGAWAVFGGLLGIGLGVRGGHRKVVNGLVGGLIGGAAGGLVFQMILNANQDGSSSAFTLRIAGFAATGLGIGLGVGLVEQVRRESWITIANGPMTGKEFILYNARTVIGSDHRCNIVLVRDPGVLAQHVAFDRTPQGATVTSLGGPITINGAAVPSARLRAGDRIGVGASTLEYQERATTAPEAIGGQPW